MGWHKPNGVNNKKELLEYLKRETNYTKPGTAYRVQLAGCYRGNNFRGVYWSVVETAIQSSPPRRYIRCDILEARSDGWWYKPMQECDGPYYCSCPVSYLDMVPTVTDRVWRTLVRDKAATIKSKAAATRLQKTK